jgi:hypothetical protein
MTTKDEIRHLRELLQHTDRWYIEYDCPDNEDIMYISEKAKEYANEKLSYMSLNALYSRFRLWAAEYTILPEDYHKSFLNDVIWDLGLNACKGSEKEIYKDCIVLKLKFN